MMIRPRGGYAQTADTTSKHISIYGYISSYVPEFGLANNGHTSGVRIFPRDNEPDGFAEALRAAEDEREREAAMLDTNVCIAINLCYSIV